MSEIRPLFSETTRNSYKISSVKSLVYHSRHQISVVTSSSSRTTNPQPLLFCDNMWPGSLVLADYLCINPDLVRGKACLELGAAIALPSMVASDLMAHSLVITDYPAEGVLENIRILFEKNRLSLSNVLIADHIWGQDIESISNLSSKSNGKFDVIFLAELLWKDNYAQHENLLQSVSSLLDPTGGIALLSFAHRSTETHTKDHDLEFLELAKQRFHMNVTLVEENSKYCDVDESTPTRVFLYKLYYSF